MNRAVDLYSIYFLSQEEGFSSWEFFFSEFCKEVYNLIDIIYIFYRVINLFQLFPKDMDQNVSVNTYSYRSSRTLYINVVCAVSH